MRLKEIVLAAFAMCAIGCVRDFHEPQPQPDMQSTQYHIGIISNGYSPDLNLTDDKYEAVLNCLGEDPAMNNNLFIIEIMGDGDYFHCPTYDCRGEIIGTHHCAGRWVYWDGIIQVVESQSALAHEIGHVFEVEFSHDPNSPSIACGDLVDGRFNRSP